MRPLHTAGRWVLGALLAVKVTLEMRVRNVKPLQGATRWTLAALFALLGSYMAVQL